MRAKAGAIAGSPRRWTPAIATVERPGAGWSRKGSRQSWPAKYNPTPPGAIFEGAAEAKLIALTLSPAPEVSPVGAAPVEEKVVELHIVERASDTRSGGR